MVEPRNESRPPPCSPASNLNLFREWMGKDAWKHNRWEARGKVPAITKEYLDKVKVKY